MIFCYHKPYISYLTEINFWTVRDDGNTFFITPLSDMHNMETVYRTVIAICLIVTIIAASVTLLRMYRTITKEEGDLKGKRSAYNTGDYHADQKCEICFDEIGDEMVSQCKCGKTYHLSCAEPTGECPYCGTHFEDFLPPREPRHVACPRCGNIVHGNICSCGTVIPDPDGTFVCRCGERIGKNEKMCRKCGRVFKTDIYAVKKEFIPNK